MVSSGNGCDLIGNGVGVCVTREGVFRRTVRDTVVYIPLDSWLRGVEGFGVGKLEVPVRRSGVDSAGRGAAGLASFWPSMGPTSLLALLCFRR